MLLLFVLHMRNQTDLKLYRKFAKRTTNVSVFLAVSKL